MSFRPTADARVYIHSLAAAAYARNASTDSQTDMFEVTTLADRAKAFIPTLESSTFSIDGPLDVDASAGGQFDAITSIKASTTNVPISYLPVSTDGGVWLLDAIETSITTSTVVAGSADWSATAQTSGQTDFNGKILENNTSVTVDTDGSTLDNGAATTNGAAIHLHVTAFSGLTSDDIIVEASTTGSFGGEETTLATFTQVTGLTSERLTVTGTVPRYLRVVDDVTGTGSITRFVAIARR